MYVRPVVPWASGVSYKRGPLASSPAKNCSRTVKGSAVCKHAVVLRGYARGLALTRLEEQELVEASCHGDTSWEHSQILCEDM